MFLQFAVLDCGLVAVDLTHTFLDNFAIVHVTGIRLWEIYCPLRQFGKYQSSGPT